MNRALIVKKEWLDKILSGEKTWEIRGSNTKIRGKIGLIESGTGLIKGECEIFGSFAFTPLKYESPLGTPHRLSLKDLQDLKYKKPHAWELKNAIRYEKPIRYNHPQGAVIWVKINNKSLIIQKENK